MKITAIKMVAVAETKQQRKLPHHLGQKNILFDQKARRFWPKPVVVVVVDD